MARDRRLAKEAAREKAEKEAGASKVEESKDSLVEESASIRGGPTGILLTLLV